MYLSIVVCSRNDNHGGHLTRRMQIFINALAAQCERHDLEAELIIVEWNPPADKPPMTEAFDWPKARGPLKIRIITVSHELHSQFKSSDNLPLYQMIAKNVGIRRAQGEFVLITNIDVIFNDALIKFLKQKKLEKNCHYRIDRTDTERDVPLEADLTAQLQYCESNLIRVNAREGVFKLNSDGHRQLSENDVVADDLKLALGTGFYPPQTQPLTNTAFRPVLNNAVINLFDEVEALYFDVEVGLNCEKPAKLKLITESGAETTVSIDSRGIVSVANPGRSLKLVIMNGDQPRPDVMVPYNLVVHKISDKPLPGPGLKPPVNAGFRLKSWFKGLFRSKGKSGAEPVDGTYYPPRLHTNACGDFALFSHSTLMDLQGYPELEMYSMHIDSLLVFQAHYAGVKEVMLEEPMRVYHIEHGAGWTQEGEEKLFKSMRDRGIGYLEYQDLMNYGAKMHQLGKPLKFAENQEEWGLGSHELPETEV